MKIVIPSGFADTTKQLLKLHRGPLTMAHRREGKAIKEILEASGIFNDVRVTIQPIENDRLTYTVSLPIDEVESVLSDVCSLTEDVLDMINEIAASTFVEASQKPENGRHAREKLRALFNIRRMLANGLLDGDLSKETVEKCMTALIEVATHKTTDGAKKQWADDFGEDLLQIDDGNLLLSSYRSYIQYLHSIVWYNFITNIPELLATHTPGMLRAHEVAPKVEKLTMRDVPVRVLYPAFKPKSSKDVYNMFIEIISIGDKK